MWIGKTKEEIKSEMRAAAPKRACAAFFCTVLGAIGMAKTGVLTGPENTSMSWLEVIHLLPRCFALGFIAAAINCYWPQKSSSTLVGCLKCGRTENTTDENTCVCGGPMVKTDFLRWADKNP
jgi:hypothetical protein